MLALALMISAPALGQVPVTMVDCFLGGRCIGTNGHDTITASNQRDVIFARAGNDTVRARGGADRIRGGNGRDSLYGGYGNDYLYSVDIFSQSGAFMDLVNCGPGNDVASVDFRDRVVNCEEVGVAIP